MNILAVVLALLAAAPALRAGSRERVSARDRAQVDFTPPVTTPVVFAFAPADGTGLGTECACQAVTGVYNGATVSVTWARSTAGLCTKRDYSVVSCASATPRVMSGQGTFGRLGVLMEPANQNDVLRNRDFSNAAWTKTSMTCTKTATGVDGSSNAASTCTSTLITVGVAVQAITRSSARGNLSLYMKRRTGTGAVNVSRDNLVTPFDVSARLSSSVWKRIVSREAVGCFHGNCIIVPGLDTTSTNPIVAIGLPVSGDSVDIDYVQDEVSSAGPSSPIETAGSAVARGIDKATVALSGNTVALNSFSYKLLQSGFVDGRNRADDSNGGGSTLMLTSAGSETIYGYPGALSCNYFLNPNFPASSGLLHMTLLGPVQYSCDAQTIADGGQTIRQCVQGGCLVDPLNPTPLTVAPTSVYLGTDSSTCCSINAVVSEVCFDGTYGRCAAPSLEPTAESVLWLGDSISNGDHSIPFRPANTLGVDLGRTVFNDAISSYTVAQASTLYFSGPYNFKHRTLVVLAGFNSIVAGLSASTAWGQMKTILDDGQARGFKVIPITVTPYAGYAGWTSGFQAQTIAYNQMMRDYSYDAGLALVDAYAKMGGGTPNDGGSADPMWLRDDFYAGDVSGVDKLHLGPDGGHYLEWLVYDAGP